MICGDLNNEQVCFFPGIHMFKKIESLKLGISRTSKNKTTGYKLVHFTKQRQDSKKETH